jgi:hypothetical protein
MTKKKENSAHRCTRCKEFHQRLIVIDNLYAPKEKICLSCLAELLIGRGQHNNWLIGRHDIVNMAERLKGT